MGGSPAEALARPTRPIHSSMPNVRGSGATTRTCRRRSPVTVRRSWGEPQRRPEACANLLPDNTIQTAIEAVGHRRHRDADPVSTGFRTANSVRVAELQVQSAARRCACRPGRAARDAVTAYTNVLANQSLVDASAPTSLPARDAVRHPASPQRRRRHANRHRASRGAPQPRLRPQRRRSRVRGEPGDIRPGDRQSARRSSGPPKWSIAICRRAARMP